MNSTILAVRAITSEYAKQLLWPVLFIGLAVYAGVIGLIWWITTMASDWWWLLAIVPTCFVIIGLGVWLIARTLILRLAPTMNAKQKSATKQFVKRLNNVTEQLGTPKFIIIYRLVKDALMRPASGKTYIGEIAQEPGDMKRAFEELRGLF